ncbi:MAG TPA: DUF362 domain-containing protein [Firmicutes bacterium]|nr:DUF362 domain-containing protein [Bacillota bacterium]
MIDWKAPWEALRPHLDNFSAFPQWVAVRQHLHLPEVTDCRRELATKLEAGDIRKSIRPGMKVAIACGSRGIANIVEVVSTLGQKLKEWGAEPFIVPAMGSHGAATAAGQARYLEELGLRAEQTGLVIKATMETVHLGSIPQGHEVFFDRIAHAADAVIPVCRIKPHTSFTGPIESGAAKMLTIGLGKQKGAESLHRGGFPHLSARIQEAARLILAQVNVPFAVCLVENAACRTALLELIEGRNILTKEPLLLKEARRLMGRLPFAELDVLLVGRIGKDISGLGMDPYVTGRFAVPELTAGIQVYKLAVLDLSPKSHGNALGIGLADIITYRLFSQIDFAATYMNVLTSSVFNSAKLPLVMPTDRAATALALLTSGCPNPAAARLVYIKDTKSIEEFYISTALLPERPGPGGPAAAPGLAAQGLAAPGFTVPEIEVLGAPQPMTFDGPGRLILP